MPKQLLITSWYKKNILTYCLLPFAYLYQLIIGIRRFCYQKNIFTVTQLPVPVIVIGNITVGGTGKTPLVIYLANWLKQQGYTPGIISRGYGGKAKHYPLKVTAQTDPAEAGDEPVMIARQTQCPVYVAPDRVAAAKQLLADNPCNFILSDDGLQHYALGRDIEIVVIDGARRLGNHYCLPAGPLREPSGRLNTVDLIVCNGQAQANEYAMQLIAQDFCRVDNTPIKQTTDYFKDKQIHAVAGIGNPTRFFDCLRQLGLQIIAHPFPDHYSFQASDFAFADNKIIIMTEKDAVKCQAFANDNYWYLPVKAELAQDFTDACLQKLRKIYQYVKANPKLRTKL